MSDRKITHRINIYDSGDVEMEQITNVAIDRNTMVKWIGELELLLGGLRVTILTEDAKLAKVMDDMMQVSTSDTVN